MARCLLPLTVLLLLAIPGAHAAPPNVGYTYTGDEDDRGFSLPAGATHVYNLSLHLAPATGDTKVDLVVGFRDFRSLHPAAIAPVSQVSLRSASGSQYTPLEPLSGFTMNRTVTGLPGGEYKVQVVSTLDNGLSLGDHPSFLGFTVRDPDARTSTATAVYEFKFKVVPPPNLAPTARFSHSASGLTVSFDSSASSDPDGDPLAFLWEFGDGRLANVPSPTHSFDAAGTYNVRLRVTDDGGLWHARTTAISLTAPTGGGNTGGNTGGNDGGNQGGTGGNTAPVDTDGDTFADAIETASGSDPANPQSIPSDRDGDGDPNEADNCPAASNADQADRDGDGIGDRCDPNANDGPTGDPDGDGKPSDADNCPAAANADQLDLDGDGKGDACDTDLDGDGVLNEADAFPLDPKESRDNDGDLLGDNADLDDDNDLIPDREEAADGSDPLDRHDPPWLASAAVALRVNGTNRVTWTAPADERIQRFLIWREASPYVLLSTVPFAGGEAYEFTDDAPPQRARYHIQAQLDGVTALSYVSADDRATNWVSLDGALTDGCEPLARDTDKDGLCDSLERQMGLDAARADTDGDGLKDGDELLGARPSLPMRADSDGDGRSDGQERGDGTDPLGPDSATVEPKEGNGVAGWLWPTLILAGAIVVAALVLRGRGPKTPPQ